MAQPVQIEISEANVYDYAEGSLLLNDLHVWVRRGSSSNFGCWDTAELWTQQHMRRWLP